MTLESLNAIAIGTLNDWLKNSPVFQPMRSKAKSFRTIKLEWSWNDFSATKLCSVFLVKSLAVSFVCAWCSSQCFSTNIIFVPWGGCHAFDSQTCQRSFLFFAGIIKGKAFKLLYWDFFLLCTTPYSYNDKIMSPSWLLWGPKTHL